MYHGPVFDQFWHGESEPGNQSNGGCILFGICGEENENHPGTYRFSSTDGVVINDAQLLTQDADVNGSGEYSKPRAGSMCVCFMPRDGAPAFINGFQDPPKWDEDGESEEPDIGTQPDIATTGDKVFQTAEGAKLIFRRGGLVHIEGGPGTSILLGTVNNQMTLRSTNFNHLLSGYRAKRGRKDPNKTAANTRHEEEFWNQVGASYDAVKLRHGDLEDDARRELTITESVSAAGQTAATLKTRETYYRDGKWRGEGPEYRWGGGPDTATEPIVLGTALVSVLNDLINAIKGITVPTAWGPSGTPLNVAAFATLANQLNKILSEFMFTSKKPAELE